MSTRERHTYHCLRCGKLVCLDRDPDRPEEHDAPPPTCCGGTPMVRAVCETIFEEVESGGTARSLPIERSVAAKNEAPAKGSATASNRRRS